MFNVHINFSNTIKKTFYIPRPNLRNPNITKNQFWREKTLIKLKVWRGGGVRGGNLKAKSISWLEKLSEQTQTPSDLVDFTTSRLFLVFSPALNRYKNTRGNALIKTRDVA